MSIPRPSDQFLPSSLHRLGIDNSTTSILLDRTRGPDALVAIRIQYHLSTMSSGIAAALPM